MGGVPARAVGGDNYFRRQLGQCLNSRAHDGDEQGTVEVKAAENGVDPFDAGEALGVADDVHDPGMTAPGEHDYWVRKKVDPVQPILHTSRECFHFDDDTQAQPATQDEIDWGDHAKPAIGGAHLRTNPSTRPALGSRSF